MQAIKTVATDPAHMPDRKHQWDAGADVRTTEDVLLQPFQRKAVPLGFKVDIPAGYVGLLLPRSGNAINYGLTFINCAGVIDAGYHGEVKALVTNISDDIVKLRRGERIGQLVVVPVECPAFQPVPSTDFFRESQRGSQGFGSTGAM